jgi:uncharacterized protein YxeA
MKQPAPVPKKPSNARVFFFISLALLLLSVASFAVFVSLNRTIKMTYGKVVDTYTKKEFASRKQTVDQEYDLIRYTVDGKEYKGKTAAPKAGGSSQYVPVYYYERFPWAAWYYSKNNASIIFCLLCAAIALGLLLYSGNRLLKNARASAPAKKQQQPPKGEKRAT